MRKRVLWLIILVSFVSCHAVFAKKIKNSFKIEKTGKSALKKNKENEGLQINLLDSAENHEQGFSELMLKLKECTFAGYDKEPTSNVESFIMVNATDKTITGFEVRIDYLDMQDRMFHSRIVREQCFVPAGESRRIDVAGWDKQHTYYYYLGNAPRKVATPFKVSFTPISYWILD